MKKFQNSLIYLTGVAGVGKTTVLQEMLKINTDLVVVSMGDLLLMRICEVNKDLTITRDKIVDYITPEITQFCIQQVRNTIPVGKIGILDTHLMPNLKDGYRINSQTHTQFYIPDLYIFVKADPHVIYKRRAIDSLRNRTVESVENIKFHQDISLSICESLVVLVNSKLVVVDNSKSFNVDNVIKQIKCLESQQ